MRFIISLFLLLNVSFVFAQSPEGVKINIRAKNETLGAILKSVSAQCEIPVSYSHAQVPVNKKMSITIVNKSLDEALSDILKPHDLEHVFVENQIIIRPKTHQATQEPVLAATYTISGYVKEKASGEAIVGATIYTDDIKYGTTSNKYGFYSLTIPEGAYTILCSFIGYSREQRAISLGKNFIIDFQLEAAEQMLEAVIITHSEDSTYFVSANKIGYTEMQSQKISRMPMFFSEPDVIKALQFMPGIKNTIDGSSNYYVRGGSRDQNLILLDDAPIYNPSHLFGFFTSINPEAVTDIKLYKSDFPAYVGGKLSSVLEMKTKEGNMHKLSGGADIGLISTRLSFEGPVVKEKVSFYLSYRRTHIENILKLAENSITDFRFDDFNAKINYRLNDKNRLLFSYYAGNDNFFLRKWDNDRNGINWKNRATSLRWNRIIGSKLFSNTTLYYSHYDYNIFGSYNNDTRWTTGIKTLGLKNDFSYFKSPDITHYFGFQLNTNIFEPGLYVNHPYPAGLLPDIQRMKTGETHLYYSAERRLADKLTVRYGLRGTMFSNKGPAEWYVIDENHEISATINESSGRYNTRVRLDPSLTLTYLLNTKNSLKFNYFRAHQYHQILSNTISPFTSVELWYPSTPNVKPQAADQLSLGYFSQMFKNRYSFNIEGFYRILYNQFDYSNQASFILNPKIEKELRFGKTKAYGTEIMFKKDYGRLQGWIGYAHTRALRHIEGLNEGAPYPAYSDRPHDFSLYLTYQAGTRLVLSSGFIYASGMPFTAPSAYYNYMGYQVPVYNKKNNARMPDYYRWDVALRLLLNKPGKKIENYLSFAIYNVTNKQNPVFINFNKIQDENGNFIIPANYAANYQLSPSQIMLLGIMPSIKYSLKF